MKCKVPPLRDLPRDVILACYLRHFEHFFFGKWIQTTRDYLLKINLSLEWQNLSPNLSYEGWASDQKHGKSRMMFFNFYFVFQYFETFAHMTVDIGLKYMYFRNPVNLLQKLFLTKSFDWLLTTHTQLLI